MYDFRIGYRYTFNTHAPAILGQSFKDAELTAIVDYDTAMLFESVHLKHNQVNHQQHHKSNEDIQVQFPFSLHRQE